jgi:hypothetical protein
MKPASFTYSKCCAFCVSLKTVRTALCTNTKAVHTCELHNFTFDYPNQVDQRVCDDYLDEDEAGDE